MENTLRLSQVANPNSEKYKGKIREQAISVFGAKNNCVGYPRWLSAFLRS